MHVDLNSDLGESFGNYTIGNDQNVIPLVSGVNIACGMHAGDPLVMRKTVARAHKAGVGIGAHPGYPDLQGFGRRNMDLSPDEIYAFVLYQLGALGGFCAAENVKMNHVKAHGQLYNHCAVDRASADALAQAVKDYDSDLVLVGLAGSQMIAAGKAAGIRTASEFFADRNYTDDGTLVPRKQPNAMVEDKDFAAERVCQAVETGKIQSATGKTIQVQAGTICVHGDSPQALDFTRLIRQKLHAHHIDIQPL